MRESKDEPIRRIVKLVEAVNHMSQLFAPLRTPIHVDTPLRRIVEKVHAKLQQFEFELQTELKRMAAEPMNFSDPPNVRLKTAFEKMLEAYQHALATNLTAHTRAMLTRQFQDLQRTYQIFTSVYLQTA